MPSKTQWEKYRAAVLAAAAQNNFRAVYGEVKKQGPAKTTGWTEGLCPLHADTSPSFGWNRDTGQFKCHAASCGQTGSVFDFIVLTGGGIDWQEAMIELGDRLGVTRPAESGRGEGKPKPKKPSKPERPPIPESLVEGWVKNLWATAPAVTWLREKRGLTDDTLRRFEIGLEPKGSYPRNTIPIRDVDGKIANVRRYNAKHKEKIKSYHDGTRGYGSPAQLFCAHLLTPLKEGGPRQRVIITEGEWDCIALWQEGFQAVTTTNGANSYERSLPNWLPIFKGRDVVILLDCDKAGTAASEKVLAGLAGAGCKSVRRVQLPLSGTPDSKDITDYFHKEQHSSADLRALIKGTAPHEYPDPTVGAHRPPPPEDILDLQSFIQIEDKTLAGRKIRCKITVIGETSESFHAVEEFRIDRCKRMGKGGCIQCFGALQPATVPHGSREYIGSCMANDRSVQRQIAEYACVHGESIRIDILKRETIKEFVCTQFAERVTQVTDSKGKRVTTVNGRRENMLEKTVYLLSRQRPSVGSYEIEGWILSHPADQKITMLIDKMTAVEDHYESFRVEDNLTDLRKFQALTLDEIQADLEANVTRIYKREDLLLACLLNLCCPLWVEFNGETIRGWLNIAVVGDSGQGKSAMIERLCAWLNVGDRFSGLTGSRTGLVYALAEHRNRGWVLTVGRYPANDGKFIAVDEAQQLDEQDIRTMSTAMDTGELQVDRVQSGFYPSRTRVMFIANPKRDQVMDSFTMGCKALASLFPPAVIRRLDLALFPSQGDIGDSSFINQSRIGGKSTKGETPAVITATMLRAVVYLAWTLPQDSIRFTEDATEAILQEATLLSDTFGHATDVPLVIRSDFRNKLARVSVAFAMLDLALDATFTTLTVGMEHVQQAEAYVHRIYHADNCQLDRYSDIQHKASTLDYDTLHGEITGMIDAGDGNSAEPNTFAKIISALWGAEYINRKDLAELVGIAKADDLAPWIQFLRKRSLIATTKSGSYYKQPKFNQFLRRLNKESPEYLTAVERSKDSGMAGGGDSDGGGDSNEQGDIGI